jgi:hypothetical protein
MNKPQKWHQVYPSGTPEGDEEARFFKALSRNKKREWHSTAALAQTAKLTRKRVEEIIDKYVNQVNPPLVYANPTNEDNWSYWERVPELLPKDDRDISQKDKDTRIKKHLAVEEIKANKVVGPAL